MSKVINHGTIDFNCKDIIKQVAKSTRMVAGFDRSNSEYGDDNYWKRITKLYDQTVRNDHFIHEDGWDSFIPDTFFSTTGIKKDPTEIAVFQVLPGKFTPPHKDKFTGFLTNNPVDRKVITKFWIPLTEPSLGHALFFSNEVVYNVKEGTIIELPKDELHSACNAGTEMRLIMTITGVRENGK